MASEASRSSGERLVDILIATVAGAILGALIVRWIPTDTLIVNNLHANSILVTGDSGAVSINGKHGISLHRDDYASALLWFHEPPNTGTSQQSGPILILANDVGPAIEITPLGQEMTPTDEEGNLLP